MSTDLTLAVNRLQALHRDVPGIRYAPDLAEYPPNLTTANLPAVLTWPADGQWYLKGGGWRTDERTMLVLLYIAPLGQNDIPSNAAEAVSLLAQLRETHILRQNVPLADPDDNVDAYQITLESSTDRPHGDGGIEPNLAFGGALYYGARLRVNVRLLWGAGS